MKKAFYIFAFAIASALTITACTEEEVKPTERQGGSYDIPDKW